MATPNVHHPTPYDCFIQIWYDVTNDIAYAQFTWPGPNSQPNDGKQGWYMCQANAFDSPFDFANAGVNPGYQFCHNYRQGAVAAGLITKTTGPGPGSVQTYP
jgi:hypothetical protein